MRRLHLLGVGGAGMSGLARVLAAQGVAVSGCDRAPAALLAPLRAAGVDAVSGHDPAHLATGPEVGVSSAIEADEPELVEARRRGLRVWHRAELLAELVAAAPRSICVAGAHGKTTTSALLAYALDALGDDPTFLVGGDVPQLGANARAGRGGVLVAEGDESDGSLARLRPRCAVVLNLDLDHHDTFASLADVEALFAGWAAGLPADGCLVLPDGLELPSAATLRRFGTGPGEGFRVHDVEAGADGVRFRLEARGSEQAVALALRGEHNALNAAAALAALDWAGHEPAWAAPALAGFRGAGRRFELHGSVAGVRLVDDYAHHPAELAATLRAARAYAAGGRVLACFQPHMPWRTRALQREFAEALTAADAACVCELYVARGRPDPEVSGKLIVDRLSELAPGFAVAWTPTYADAAVWLGLRARPGDVVLTAGAGPVDAVLRLLRDRLA